MTMTPIATIADALIDFILSLLRDPAAAAEYQKDPETSLANAGLGNACLADVRQVAPVIYDKPEVVVREQPSSPPPSSHPSNPVQQAISNIVNNFSVDNRSTIVDQSVNQNIWAHGDVSQVFDQHAVINTGDNGTAAGHDATTDNSTTAIGGDLNVGNTANTTNVDSSFNDSSDHSTTDTDTTVTGSFNDSSDHVNVDADNSAVAVDASDHPVDPTDHPVDATAQPVDDTDASTDASASSFATPEPTVDDSSDTASDSGAPEDLFVDDQP